MFIRVNLHIPPCRLWLCGECDLHRYNTTFSVILGDNGNTLNIRSVPVRPENIFLFLNMSLILYQGKRCWNEFQSAWFQAIAAELLAFLSFYVVTPCGLVNTRWFKYDRDKLWLVYTQIVPVIFESPCTYWSLEWRSLGWVTSFRTAWRWRRIQSFRNFSQHALLDTL
jgi:hypothetical protein